MIGFSSTQETKSLKCAKIDNWITMTKINEKNEIYAIIITRNADPFSPDFKVQYIYARDQEQQSQLENMLNNLDRMLRNADEILVKNTKMGVNEKEWIRKILEARLSEEVLSYCKYLLNSLTKYLKTRSKTYGKYVSLVILKDRMYIIHGGAYIPGLFLTRREEISLGNPIAVAKNILRYAKFYPNKEGEIVFRERDPYNIKGFADFLGIEIEESIEEGEVKFIVQLSPELSFPFSLSYEKFLSLIEKKKLEIDIKRKLLIIHGEKARTYEFPIYKVLINDEEYYDLAEFLAHIKSISLELDSLQEQFVSLINGLDFSTGAIQCIERKDGLYVMDTGTGKERKRIRNKADSLTIIYSYVTNRNRIEFSQDFLSALATFYIHDRTIKLYFINLSYSDIPVKISGIEIYNSPLFLDIKMENTLKTFNSLIEENIDQNIKRLLKLALVQFFIKYCLLDPNIKYFFKRFEETLLDTIYEELNLKEQIVQHETDLLEFKSADIFCGDNRSIINKLEEVISKKMKDKDFLVIVIGIDEKERKIRPIPTSRVSDDRINSIEKALSKKLNLNIYLLQQRLNSQGTLLYIVISRH